MRDFPVLRPASRRSRCVRPVGSEASLLLRSKSARLRGSRVISENRSTPFFWERRSPCGRPLSCPPAPLHDADDWGMGTPARRRPHGSGEVWMRTGKENQSRWRPRPLVQARESPQTTAPAGQASPCRSSETARGPTQTQIREEQTADHRTDGSGTGSGVCALRKAH